jgi:hypothetical protein
LLPQAHDLKVNRTENCGADDSQTQFLPETA